MALAMVAPTLYPGAAQSPSKQNESWPTASAQGLPTEQTT
jgi:hypothetical protein